MALALATATGACRPSGVGLASRPCRCGVFVLAHRVRPRRRGRSAGRGRPSPRHVGEAPDAASAPGAEPADVLEDPPPASGRRRTASRGNGGPRPRPRRRSARCSERCRAATRWVSRRKPLRHVDGPLEQSPREDLQGQPLPGDPGSPRRPLPCRPGRPRGDRTGSRPGDAGTRSPPGLDGPPHRAGADPPYPRLLDQEQVGGPRYLPRRDPDAAPRTLERLLAASVARARNSSASTST